MAKLKGIATVRQKLDAAEKLIRAHVVEGMDSVMADLLEKSNDLAPIDTGELIASGKVVGTGSNQSVIARGVAYTALHADIMHESFYTAGKKTRAKAGAGRKFLKRAYDANKDDYTKEIARTVRVAVNTGSV